MTYDDAIKVVELEEENRMLKDTLTECREMFVACNIRRNQLLKILDEIKKLMKTSNLQYFIESEELKEILEKMNK